MGARTIAIEVEAGVTVSGVLHAPPGGPGVGVVLGHGAGSDMTNPLVVAVAEGLARQGHATLRFNFPYTERGRKAPDPPARLEQAVRAAAAALRSAGPRRLVLGGKSMGGRIASVAAARGLACDGLVFLGYPLHDSRRAGALRDAHLDSVTAPMLFVQGTRDRLCELDRLRPVLARLGSRATLHVVEGGDHSLALPRSAGRSRDSVHAEVVAAIARGLET